MRKNEAQPLPGFSLHPQLAADTHPVCRLSLCRVLLMDDQRFPWLILVPERPDLREVFDLAPEERALLMEEISHVAERFATLTGADKMNVAALGNMVPQLHVHVIARFTKDDAWPGPVWSASTPRNHYMQSDRDTLVSRLRGTL